MTTPTNWQRGHDLGLMVREIRADGGDIDIRWDLADEAKTNTGEGFGEFMAGLNAAWDDV